VPNIDLRNRSNFNDLEMLQSNPLWVNGGQCSLLKHSKKEFLKRTSLKRTFWEGTSLGGHDFSRAEKDAPGRASASEGKNKLYSRQHSHQDLVTLR